MRPVNAGTFWEETAGKPMRKPSPRKFIFRKRNALGNAGEAERSGEWKKAARSSPNDTPEVGRAKRRALIKFIAERRRAKPPT